MDSLRQLIDRRATESPASVYLEDARSERTFDYAALAAAVQAWQTLLEDSGIPSGGAVLVDVGDPLCFAVVHLAVVSAGRRAIPVDPDVPRSELTRLSVLAGGAALLVSDRGQPVELAGVTRAGVDPVSGNPADVVLGDVALGTVHETRTPGLSPTGSVVLFTSGSTGAPKGVELPERQLLFVARAVAKHNGLTSSDRGYNPLPLFHVNAEVVGLLSTLVAGATLVLDRRFHRTGFWELLKQRRVTWLNAVPAMLAVLGRGDSIDAPASLRFIRSASAPLPDAVRKTLHGIPLVVSYGMTEAASQITATPLGEPHREGSVGLPVGAQVQVRSENGTVLPSGEIGSLWIRGEGIIEHYYLGRAADRFDQDGWLSTGDLGTLDEDGYVYLVGRSDDVINRGGEKVYPSEVEDVLLNDERIREAVVVARPDDILGHVPIAYVIPRVPLQGEALQGLIQDLRECCAQELPRFKRPVEINVAADVPRAPTGKVQRDRVRAMALADTPARS